MQCVRCGEEGFFVCEKCRKTIPLNTTQVCLVCKKDSVHGITHEQCSHKTHLDGLIVAARYHDNPLLEKLIERFKFQYATSLSVPLALLLVQILEKNTLSTQNTIIIPVPLHKSRKTWRGFNQAELLAHEVAKYTNSPVYDIIQRIKKTKQQSKLSRKERLENVRDVFAVETIHELSLQNKTILLIDDVASTTATLEESAKALKLTGAEKVIGLVLARG